MAVLALLAAAFQTLQAVQQAFPAALPAPTSVCQVITEDWLDGMPAVRTPTALAKRTSLLLPPTARPLLRCAADFVTAAPVHSGDRRLFARAPTKQQPEPLPTVEADAMRGAWRLLIGLQLDLNTVVADELTLVSGIGAKAAAALVAHRRAHGRFDSLRDLQQVPGIGPKRAASLSSLLYVGPSLLTSPSKPARTAKPTPLRRSGGRNRPGRQAS
jgi:competence ComEA-like helix-hairpin-helix protein